MYRKVEISEALKPFKYQMEIPVRWGDMDAFEHVNNTVFLKWVETARVNYLTEFVTGPFSAGRLGPILAKQDCRYVYPLAYPDTAILGFRASEIQDDRIICECKIYSKKESCLSAIVYNTIMAYDFEYKRKADIPLDWVMKIQKFED